MPIKEEIYDDKNNSIESENKKEENNGEYFFRLKLL